MSDLPVVPREELVVMVAKAHHGSAYGEASLAGKTLADQSKLPRLVAENLGAGFGQWDFFPEATEIVDFAMAYVPPSNEDELWVLARSWASDEAAERRTMLTLVGRDILMHELRRIDVPQLRELIEERRPTRALAMRAALGLEVPKGSAPKPPPSAPTSAPTSKSADGPRRAAPPSAPRRPPELTAEGTIKMPKPEFVKPPPAPPKAPPKRYSHPKFGTGVLVSQTGAGPEAKLTVKFESGPKTLVATFLTEVGDSE